jgi:hypothetical protein
LNWSKYVGNTVLDYEIWSKNNNTWTLLSSTTDTNASINLLKNESYCLYVKANLQNGFSAFSNPLCFVMPQPTPPSFHYFSVASVLDGDIELKAWVDQSVGITSVLFERKDTNGVFELIGEGPTLNNTAYFLDEDVDTDRGPWTYRSIYLDSCGNPGAYANENSTIFVQGNADQYNMIPFLGRPILNLPEPLQTIRYSETPTEPGRPCLFKCYPTAVMTSPMTFRNCATKAKYVTG